MASSSSNFLRNLAAVVCVLIVASSAAALFSIHYSSMNHGRTLERFNEFKVAINSARIAQVSFKTQVQEWKNVLLRGQDPKDYDEYFKRFVQNEAEVDKELESLGGLMRKLGLDPAEVASLQAEHAALGKAYRDALGLYRKGDVNSVLAVDKSIRGIDRKMNADIDGLVARIDAKGDSFLKSFSEKSATDEALFRKILLGLAVVTAAATFTFIFKALSLGNK